MIMKRALLIVDPQIDFITGSLAVDGAREAMDSLAAYIGCNAGAYSHIIVTADRHPFAHCSFRDEGGRWPRHCLHDSVGAAVWPPLMEALYACQCPVTFLHKGEDAEREEYSIFASPAASRRIAGLVAGTDVVDVCGIAGDVCVADTLRDGINLFGPELFNVLTRFTPSIDCGETIDSIISKFRLSCDR